MIVLDRCFAVGSIGKSTCYLANLVSLLGFRTFAPCFLAAVTKWTASRLDVPSVQRSRSSAFGPTPLDYAAPAPVSKCKDRLCESITPLYTFACSLLSRRRNRIQFVLWARVAWLRKLRWLHLCVVFCLIAFCLRVTCDCGCHVCVVVQFLAHWPTSP